MAKDKITEYDSTAANNTVVGDVNLAENSALPSDMNNAVRELMSHLKEFAEGTNGINVLSLADDDASASIKFQAPSAVTSDTTFTLPDGDGESGQTLVTNGSGTLAWHAPYGNRNLIINGAMQVAQRGTSETGVTTEQYANAPDRFKFIIGNAGTWTVSQSTTAPEGFSNSYKLDCTTADSSLAAGDYILVSQFIEGQNLQHLKKGTSNAESITLSFWVRSAKTGTYIVEIRDNDNTRSISQSYTVSSADTWEHKSLTYSGDTTGTLGNDNGNSLAVQFWLAAGSTFSSGTLATSWGSVTNANRAVGQVNLADSTSNDWYITGVQLEVGSATPFEHRSFGDELARCQRYFYKVTNAPPGGVAARFGQGHALNSTTVKAVVPIPVTLRTVPTVTSSGVLNVSDASVGTAVTSLGLEAVTSSAETVCLTANVASGLTGFRPMFLEGQGGADESISIDAEL